MAWLLRGDQVLASLEVPSGFAARNKGLVGYSCYEGAILLEHANGCHSVAMRFDLDVAWLDKDLVVMKTATLKRYRVALPRRHAKAMLEAEAGAFERWGLKVGDRLETTA
jgi:uncharacterized membrane protein (UPF0127 family)